MEEVVTPRIKIVDIDYLEGFRTQLLACTDELQIESMLKWFLEYYDVPNATGTYSQHYWRARKCDSEHGFQYVSELMSPPSEIVQAGRMNEANRPMFYASLSADTALREISAKTGDVIQIAGFRNSKGTNIRHFMVGEFLNTHRGISTISYRINESLRVILRKLPPKEMRSFVYMDALVAEILRDPNAHKTDYIHSRILSRLIMHQIAGLDGVIYPSVALESAMNIALKPNCSKTKLQLTTSSIIKIEKSYCYGLFEPRIVKIAKGETANGAFVWN